MVRRGVSEEQIAVLRAGLLDVARAGTWDPEGAAGLVDVALRRWLTFERRSRPNKRSPELHVLDLRRGLEQQYGSNLYLEPGWLTHVAKRFGEYLLTAGPEPER
ncbi:hypothetical protein [Micromonospora humi]|uniref:hypothetical protein n=1 Tax=Micromonospora humi TaxID=745366 RepID=UPI001112D952|nr:hypothetical protein [Micromonospora humi]